MKKLMYKGIKYGYFIFLFIIILSAFFRGNLVLAQSSNINYNFQNGYAYNGLLPESSVLTNQRNRTDLLPNGVYPATYSFTDETGLNDSDIPYVEGVFGTAFVEIENIFEGHLEILHSISNTGSNFNTISFLSEIGTLEFWINVISNRTYFFMGNGSVNPISILIYPTSIRFYHDDGGGGSTYTQEVHEGGWVHIRLDFDCINDYYSGYVNGILVIDNEIFENGKTVNSFTESQYYNSASFDFYIDAIGYSWLNPLNNGTFFDTSSEDQFNGITWDGNSFWILGQVENKVYEYNASGVYTGFSFDVSDSPEGITWDGTYFWINHHYLKEVRRYTELGVYTGVSFDISGQDTTFNDITWDGTYFYLTGHISTEIYQYDTSGVYTEFHFDTDGQPEGVVFDGIYFYVSSSLWKEIKQYDASGVYTGYVFDTSGEGIFPMGLCLVDNYIWTVFYSTDIVYRYDFYSYEIGDNLVCPKILTDVLEVDKFEFTYDDSGNMNVNGDDDVSGFTDIENDFFSGDVVNIVDSDGNVDKAIRITSAQLGYCGIERDFDTDYVNTSEIHWQLDLLEMGYPESQIYTRIYNNASEIIAWFKLDGAFYHSDYPHLSILADLSYYYNSEWLLLQSNIPVGYNYDMTFELNWTNGDDYGVLRFDNQNHVILFDKNQDSIGNFQIYAITDHNVVYNTLDFQIDWVRIIVNGSSLSDEIMPDNLFILSGNPFSLLTQSFIEIVFDITYENNVTIYLNDDILLLDYTYNVSAEGTYFRNLYQDKSYYGLYLKIYNSTDYNIESIRIYGIQMANQQDSNDNPFLEFDYSNVDPNVSYFYVSGNDLYYHLETDDSNLEYIQATFDISDLSCEGYAVAFTHFKGTTYLQSECKVVFTSDTYLSFLSINGSQSESVILPQDKTIQEIVFLVTDDNKEIVDTSDGYFSDFTFIYYSDIGITITTLSLFDVLPIVVIVVVIPLALYVGFGKRKELLVPAIMGMSIFGTVIGIIPLWLEFVILFGCISTYLIRKVKSG